MRRSGKSYLLFTLFHDYLTEQGINREHIIGVDWGNIYNEKLRNPLSLLEYIAIRIKDTTRSSCFPNLHANGPRRKRFSID